MTADAGPWSQVRAIGEPAPKSWGDYERGCLSTYGGGYHEAETLRAFRHGMSTVFRLLSEEFPSAEDCAAAPRMREALERAQALLSALSGEAITYIDAVRSDALCEALGLNPWAVNEGLVSGDERVEFCDVLAEIRAALEPTP